MSKHKKKDSLTYFLDHPQIKRHPSPGNGNTPGSLADKINFGGKSTPAPKPTQPTSTPQPKPSSSSSSSSSGVMGTLKSLFKGK